MTELLYKDEIYQIIGAAMEVHNELGNGFLEAVYQEALEIEFIERKIPYKRESSLLIKYKTHILKKEYRADFVCYDKIIVETKAISQLTGADDSQAINYLKATGFRLALLLNFGEKSLKYKRIIRG